MYCNMADTFLFTDRHCHERKTGPDMDRRARRKLLLAMALSLTFMIGEVIGRTICDLYFGFYDYQAPRL